MELDARGKTRVGGLKTPPKLINDEINVLGIGVAICIYSALKRVRGLNVVVHRLLHPVYPVPQLLVPVALRALRPVEEDSLDCTAKTGNEAIGKTPQSGGHTYSLEWVEGHQENTANCPHLWGMAAVA